jgi:hypothetical protein
MNVPLSTSDSFSLPVVISPAYKFVPIGYESDDNDDDCTFSSGDYDICKSDSELDSIDKFSTNKKGVVESKSFVDASQTAAKSYGMRVIRSEPTRAAGYRSSQVERTQTEDDLTPFEIDQNTSNSSGQGQSKKCSSTYSIPLTRSSSSLDLLNEEFSIVTTTYESEETKPQSIDNDDCKNDKAESDSVDLWFILEQVASLMSCGARSTYY